MAIPFSTGETVTNAEMNELARAHWRKTTSNKVVSTTSWTDLLNNEITIDAGAMSTNRMLRLTAWGDLLNATGSTQSMPGLEFAFGPNAHAAGVGSVVVGTAFPLIASTWAANASRWAWRLIVEIMNLGATNSQWATLNADLTGVFVASQSGLFSPGEGIYATNTADQAKAIGGAASTVDTTVAVPIALGVLLPVSSASCDVTLKAAVVEVV